MIELKNTMVSGITLSLLLVGILISTFSFANTGVNEAENLEPFGATAASATETVDWWPMFHHDLSHTGYSTSTAPNTNQTLWNYTTGGSVRSSPAVVGDRVYAGSYDYKVYCLNASTGAPIWSYTTGGGVFSSPAVVGGRVYVGSDNGRVYCLNALTGAYIWSYTTGHLVRSSPAVVGGRVYVGSYDGRVYCLDASTGAPIWSYTTGDFVFSSPAVVGGRVYVGSDNGRVYCLNASTGAYIWSYRTGSFVESSPAVVGGRVYAGSYDYKVYCLDASTGAPIWDYKTGGQVHSSPAVADGKVYVGSNDNKTYCLDALTGAYLWSYTTGDFVRSSPAVADGKVYVGSYDGRVYCLDALTGAYLWSYTTGDFVESSPAVAEGKVYIGSVDHKVYAFGLLLRGVRVWDIAPSKTVLCQGCLGNVTVTVENLGDVNETFGLIVYSGSLGDPTPAQIETFWSMGDVNRDGYVNDVDIYIIGEAWGSTPGSPRWNPDADINQDLLVDSKDLHICIFNYDKNIWAHFGLAVVIAGQTVVDLLPGTSRYCTLTWNATGFVKGNYTLTAYAIPVPGETDVVDNTFIDGWVILSMIGDITGSEGYPDGECNMMDVATVSRYFGQDSPPAPANYDVIYDGAIDMVDVATVAKHFGETDP